MNDELTKKLEHIKELNFLNRTHAGIALALYDASDAANRADRDAFQKAWATVMNKSADFLDQAHALMTRLEDDPQTGRQQRLQEFLNGFAKAADINLSEADAQWAGYSRQLSDHEREQIENQGQDSGFEMGTQFRKLYPK
jgi:hypothetical protein